MTETEKANLQWLDQNRKNMLAKGVDILHKQAVNRKHGINEEGHNEDLPSHINPSFKNIPNQFFNNNYNNGLTSFNNLPSPAQRVSTAQVGQKGYRMTVKQVKSYEGHAPLCVKLLVL